LESFLQSVLKITENIIAPYFVLHDLRIWADHRDAQNLFKSALKRLNIQPENELNHLRIYQKFILEIWEFHNQFLKRLQNYTKT